MRANPFRWRQLLAPGWLDGLLAERAVPHTPRGAWRLFEVGFDGRATYEDAHIPQAGYIDTGELEVQPLWNKVSDQALLRVLLANGVRHDTTVILYGRNMLAAARAAHLMLYAGVADVRLLDGGFRAWQRANLPLARGPEPSPPSCLGFGCAFPARPDYLIDTGQARRLLGHPDGALVSVRTWNEFTGRSSGYSYIAARGDIPGARWGRAGDGNDVNCMSAYQYDNGTMRAPHEIEAMWREAGIHECQQAAFYCGTGWRASLAFFCAWMMNWERISVYDGGWCEWSRDPANPVLRRACH